MLEAVAEVGALPGGVLEQDQRCGAAPRAQQCAKALRNQPQPLLLGAGRERAGVHDEPEQAERVGAVVFLDAAPRATARAAAAPRQRC